MKRRRPGPWRWRTCFCSLLLVLAAGCGKSKGTISGRVTYKGTPLTSGTIIFHSSDGYVDSTSINARGEYTLANFPVGTAKITVVTQPYEKETPSGVPSKPGATRKRVANFVAIPKKYSDPEQSDLTWTVESGSQQYDIDLK